MNNPYIQSMNFGNIHNLGLVKPLQPRVPPQELDDERKELRAKGKELFSGRSINWDKLGLIDRLKVRLSSSYEAKVRDEFKIYIKDRLIKNMNGLVQTYTNNNLNELRNNILQISDLSVDDIKELNSIIKEKETALATKFFADEKEKFLADLIDRKYLTQEQADALKTEHPEYEEITSREQFAELRSTIYNKFNVPPNEQ